jgi:hypothetical protein
MVVFGCSGIRGARERPYDLSMAVLKGFEGPVYYVGSEGDFSYFRAGEIFHTKYKVRTDTIRLPFEFSPGHGKPYLATMSMVPYPPQPSTVRKP